MDASYDISLTYNKPVYVEGRRELPRRVLDQTQCMIFDLLLEPPTQDRVHVDIIKNWLGIPTAEVESVIEIMLQDGIHFTTVDADTFDIIDYFLWAYLIFQLKVRETLKQACGLNMTSH